MLQRTPARYLVEPAPSRISRSALTKRFRNAWKMAVSGIIEAGRVLLDGKEQLEHGEFLDWLDADLHLHERKAQMLMLIARHPVLSNTNHASYLPASWTTLYALTFLCRPGQNPRGMLELIRSGKIHPFMTREDAVALLLPGRQQINGMPFLGADLARLHDHFSQLTVEEAIASLRADPRNTPKTLRELGRKLVQIAREWRETD